MSRATSIAMANLADGIQSLVQHMRAEQQMIRDWVEAQATQNDEIKKVLKQIARETEQRLMPLARARRAQRPVDYWPGFVDALTTMLLVITFLLSVFMLAQFFLAREVSGKDTVLTKLNKQIAELTAQLALAQMNKSDAREPGHCAERDARRASRRQNAALQGEIAAAGAGTGSADARVTAAEQAA